MVWKSCWVVHCFDNNRGTVWGAIDLLSSKNLMGIKENFCYSTPSLGNPGTYVNQSWCQKTFGILHDLIFWGKLQNLLWMELITDAPFDVAYFSYRCGLWNLQNRGMLSILVLGLPVWFNWISKKPSWEIMVSCKCLCGE